MISQCATNKNEINIDIQCMYQTPMDTKPDIVWSLIEHERDRQKNCCELIASENFTSMEVMRALGSCLTNKYSEGYPGKRYYGGNEWIDRIEELCIQRALDCFHLDVSEWGVNVQPLSGCTANLAAYASLLQPGDRILGLALSSGGHLSHGFRTETKKISVTSIYYESFHYHTHPETGLLDYDAIARLAYEHKPRAIVCGASAYPRDWDYARLREIADSVNAYLYVDMAHIAGLVAVGEQNNPFEHADIVMTTTHKTLRGPRSGMIFFRRKYERAVNETVFPGMFGGPHNHQIAALAVALREAMQPSFHTYIKAVKENARTLAQALIDLGYNVVTGGTDNHIVLVNLRDKGLTGSKVESVCEAANITLNKNTVPGDTRAMNPSGIRLGTAAMTTRGMDTRDFKRIAGYLDRAIKIATYIQSSCGTRLEDFKRGIPENVDLIALRNEVSTLCGSFPYYNSYSEEDTTDEECCETVHEELDCPDEKSVTEKLSALERFCGNGEDEPLLVRRRELDNAKLVEQQYRGVLMDRRYFSDKSWEHDD